MNTNPIYLDLIHQPRDSTDPSVHTIPAIAALIPALNSIAATLITTAPDNDSFITTTPTDSLRSSSAPPSWMPSDPSESAPPFDPSVPHGSDFNPSDFNKNPGGALGKFYYMLSWLQYNPGNKLGAETFLLYISNVLKDPNVDPATKAAIEKTLNQSNLVKSLISTLEFMYFYNTNPKDRTVANLQAFLGQLQGLFPSDGSPFSTAINAYCTTLSSEASTWITTHSDKDHQFTADEANWIASGMMALLINAANLSQTGNNLRAELIDRLMKTVKNPLLLLMLLIMAISMNGSGNQLEGYGNTSTGLSQGNSTVSSLVSQFSQGAKTFDPTTDAGKQAALAFGQKLKDLQIEVDNDPRFSGIKAGIDATIGGLLNTVVPGSGSPTPALTIKQLIDDPTDTNLKNLANYLKNAATPYTDGTPPTTNQDYSTWMNAFKTAQTNFSNQSSTVSTEVGQVTNMINTCENYEKSTLSSYSELIGNAVKHQNS